MLPVHSRVRLSESVTTRAFLPESRRVPDRSRKGCRAILQPARDRTVSRRPLRLSRLSTQAAREVAHPRPPPEYVPTPACRDNGPRTETARIPVVLLRAPPPLRTVGARRHAGCCGG